MDDLYRLDDEELATLTAEALKTGERLPDGLVVLSGDADSIAGRLGRWLEQQVFAEAFGDHDPAYMSREYAQWESASLFALIVDEEGPVALQRAIWSPNSSRPTKTEFDLDLTDGSPRAFHCGDLNAPIWELATTAIRPAARGTLALAWVLGEIYAQMNRRYRAPFFAMITIPFYTSLRAMGFPIGPLMDLEPREYLNVVSQPAFMSQELEPTLVTSGRYAPVTDGFKSRSEKVNVLDLVSEELIDLTDDVMVVLPPLRPEVLAP